MFYINGYARVFEIENKGNYATCNLSTYKKNKEGQYENMYWKGRFVGTSMDKLTNTKSSDRIKITNGIIENYYNKETKRAYTTIIIFDYDKIDK